MELKEYLINKKLGIYQFARICNLSHTVIYRVLNGNKVRAKTAVIIKHYTNGIVDYDNLYVRQKTKKVEANEDKKDCD